MAIEKSTSEKIWRVLKKKIFKWQTLENWRKCILLICVVALGIDPLFLFVPLIDSKRTCFTFDKKFGIAVCVLRTFIDTFYVFHIIFHVITEVIAPRYQSSSRGEIVVHSIASVKRSILFYLTSDILSVLPIPQVAVLILFNRSDALVSKVILKWIILSQYIPRTIRIYPLYKEVTLASGTVAESKWIGAAFYIFLYMLHSYVFGAFWYVSSLEKRNKCWRQVCASISECDLDNQFCRRSVDNSQYLNTTCPLIEPDKITNSTEFNFGMYYDALKSDIVEVKPDDFPRKFFYCFWWGLRNISALGQNLKTSNSVGDIIFAIMISIAGLLLLAVLIGNVQKYLQSNTLRVDEMEEKKRDTEKWMLYRKLPIPLKDLIRKHEDHKWQQTRGVVEEAFLLSLPKELRVDTKRHLYKKLLNRVPWLTSMDDEWLLDALCDRVKSVIYTAKSYVVREGDSIEKMLIVTKGDLESTTSCYHSIHLKAGDICGDLLFWILDPYPSFSLPTSIRTIKTINDVEGFVLLPDDLTFVASHLIRNHSLTLLRMFRFYSTEWRSWAVSLIQAAWREHRERKPFKILNRKRYNKKILQGTKLAFSKLVSKPLRNQHENAADCSSTSHMLPHKPADPTFADVESKCYYN